MNLLPGDKYISRNSVFIWGIDSFSDIDFFFISSVLKGNNLKVKVKVALLYSATLYR